LIQEKFPAIFAGNPSWSPDGKIIAVPDFFAQQSGEPSKFEAVDVASGRKTPIASFGSFGQVLSSAWLPDGSGLLVAVRGPNTNWVTQIGFLSYPGGQFRRVTNDLNRYDDALSLTQDGRSLVTVAFENSNNIWVMPASGGAAQATQISSGKAEAGNLDWAPDGRILSATAGPQGFEFNLRQSDGTGKTTIFTEPVPSFFPAACGDGHYIVFNSVRSSKGQTIWRMDAGGGNLKEITGGPIDGSPVCSPDGQWVIYNTLQGNGTSVFKVSIDGGASVKVSPQVGFAPAVSPDGKLIAFGSVDGTEPNLKPVIIVGKADGSGELNKIPFDPRATSRVRVTPDWRSLSYIVNERGVSNLWAQPLGGGGPKQLTDFKTDLIFDYAWSRDGKQLALSRGQVSRDVVLLTDTTK